MFAAILCAAGLWSCSDELDSPFGAEVEEGLPTLVTVPVESADMVIVSRGELDEGLDKKITSLWIGVYNANSGERTGSAIIHNSEMVEFHERKSITLEAMSGPSYIVGVANVEYRRGSIDGTNYDSTLEEALAGADTFDKFREMTVAFGRSGEISIEAPLNPLVSGGFYTETEDTEGELTEPLAVTLKPGIEKLSGAIHLRPIYSQVKFKLSYNTTNISKMQIDSWQVVNLPTSCWLAERSDGSENLNSPDSRPVNGKSYSNSELMTDVTNTGGTLGFDFWMLENRRTGRTPSSDYNNDNAYKWREKEYKNADGSNSGKYMSLVASADDDSPENMATYVVFNVTMEMSRDENGKPLNSTSRTVEAAYVVHLGYCEGGSNLEKAVDFSCRRNSKYTYNVKINNINDLMVEANREGEVTPGVEGVITDITDTFWELDAHYSCVNVNFTADNLRNFQYYIDAYDLNGARVIIDSRNKSTVPASGSNNYRYLSWVEFRKTTGENVIAQYKPASDAGTYRLDEMNGSRTAGWYTMFVNEYVYEDDSNESSPQNWHGYVNRPDRRLWLNVDVKVSDDGQTRYSTSKYAISQQSIQTYYAANATESGLGVEHENESFGLNLRNNFRWSSDGDKTSGRKNLTDYLLNVYNSGLGWWEWESQLSAWTNDRIDWSDHLNLTSFQTVNAVNNQNYNIPAHTVYLPAIVQNSNGNDKGTTYNRTEYDPDKTSNPKYIEVMRACLNRNRDLDGDGKIDGDELRWFLPTTAQYIRLILGRRSLVHPILDVTGITRLPNNSGTNNGENASLLYGTSDGSMVWLMEGTSSSQWAQWGGPPPWQIRCVRNLGVNQANVAQNQTQPAFYIRTGTNIVDLSRYEVKSLREEAYTTSDWFMPPHHIYDQRYNRCYKAFEYSSSMIYFNDSRLGVNNTEIVLSDYLANNNPCSYLEASTGKKGWRVPNQKELSILCALGVVDDNADSDNTFTLSCSFTYFDYDGYVIGNNPNNRDGAISSAFHYALKAVTHSNNMTQAEAINGEKIENKKYGFRCVRDVLD